jgi:predicted nucleic acid-binding protein
VTVIDTSGAVDLLVGGPAFADVRELVRADRELAAPDVLVSEVIAVLRRTVRAGAVSQERAGAAITDLGDAPLRLFPSLRLRRRAWELRENLTAADALFVALAEPLGEPLATKDRALATAVAGHSAIDIELVRLP